MFDKAVVGLDLSPAEKPMMDCLLDLGRWGIREIVLVHVIRVGYVEGAGFGHENEYASWLNEKAESLTQAGFRVSIVIRDSGVVADELLRIAGEEHASLLIVGSRSHNLVHELFLGSVARSVLHKATLPVLLERIEPSPEETAAICSAVCREKLTRLLLATDFSESAHPAEQVGLSLLARADRGYLLSVIEPAEKTPEHEQRAQAVRQKMRTLKQQASEFEDRLDLMIRTGDPGNTIAQIAEEIEATLIVLGKHGQSWVPGALIGTTAESVCVEAKRPVLMVPHAQRE